jgi:two-component system, OmpR family, phosphate regulon sensor histidine kinase PhoR
VRLDKFLIDVCKQSFVHAGGFVSDCLRNKQRIGSAAMHKEIDELIKKTAARVRARDFVWAVGISAGVGLATLAIGGVAKWDLVLIAWVAFMAALAVRYRLSSGRVWAEPIQSIVEMSLNAKQAEIADLQIARGVAQALPEPLFILGTDGVVEHANPAAEELVGSKEIEGRHFAAVLRSPDVFEAAESVLKTRTAQTVDFITTGAVQRSCRAYVAPLDMGANTPDLHRNRSLVFIWDLTSERRLEEMRVDFIASASHELRTPLASLLGFIETMKGHAKEDPEAREKFLSIMQAQAERMQRLVADLMSLSRIELNEHVPPRDVVDLADIASDVVESHVPLFDQAGAIVDFINDAALPTAIAGDRDEVFQAIQNLLDNAVKYGGDPALIKVRVGRGAAPPLVEEGEPGHRAGDSAAQTAGRLGVQIDDLVFVQIRDFGPGIERADLPRLTERFYRVNIERSRKSGGTGLGLAIVKHVLNRHQGGFQIESRLAGGTAFNCYFLASR